MHRPVPRHLASVRCAVELSWGTPINVSGGTLTLSLPPGTATLVTLNP
jgi:hypothetical protein